MSFSDSGLDTKGAAFEYFVRATLNGKGLGQYFTPRPVVELMSVILGKDTIANELLAGEIPRVLDPACGTGGFLVYTMKECLSQLQEKVSQKVITERTYKKKKKIAESEVFFGADAFEGAASSAKMNMIIADDGHSNIRSENSLKNDSSIWKYEYIDERKTVVPSYDFILSNPPFGTSEQRALKAIDISMFPIKTTKGQHLFLQRMLQATYPDGYVCTVIDEGVLNTNTAIEIRKWIMQNSEVKLVLKLPDETFKPNKINVKSSILLLKKRKNEDCDFELDYTITFCELDSLGYYGSGETIRNFDFSMVLKTLEKNLFDYSLGQKRTESYWRAFDIRSSEVYRDETFRLDYKFWDLQIRDNISALKDSGGIPISNLNTVKTERGVSPKAELYVDEKDGYALVVKAGSSISQSGELIINSESDWIEKVVYDEINPRSHIIKGDVLLSSTGEGTLGKCCVYNFDSPAIAEGHITIIRVNPDLIDPYYLCDYLRCGFGQVQINRLFTGSTGMIELGKESVNEIIVDMKESVSVQRKVSKALRKQESQINRTISEASEKLIELKNKFNALNF